MGARDYSLEKFKKYVAGIVCNPYFCIYICILYFFTLKFLLSTVNCISVDRGPSISEDNLELNMNQARDICNPIQSKRDYSAPCQRYINIQ